MKNDALRFYHTLSNNILTNFGVATHTLSGSQGLSLRSPENLRNLHNINISVFTPWRKYSPWDILKIT
jgi:hypothetical protein